jgi:NitT/TauT family transport system substrate-binding protein
MGRRTALALTALALLTSACASSAARSRGSAEVLRLGIFPNLTHAPGLVALASGALERELGSTKVDVHPFNSGKDAIAAISSGALDATYIGPGPTLSIFERSGKVAVVAGVASGGASFVIRKGSGIEGPEDLHGKKVAVPGTGNTQDVALQNWLHDHGLKSKDNGGDVQVLAIENTELPQLFRAGELDGAWEPEPWPSLLIDQGLAATFVDEATLWPGGGFVTTTLLVSTGYLDAHPDIVRNLVRAHVEAIRLIEDEPERAKSLANGELEELGGVSLPDPVLDAAWEKLTFSWDPLTDAFAEAAADSAAVDVIDEVPANLAELFALDLLGEVLREEGLEAVEVGS